MARKTKFERVDVGGSDGRGERGCIHRRIRGITLVQCAKCGTKLCVMCSSPTLFPGVYKCRHGCPPEVA